jgi:predicted GTPase
MRTRTGGLILLDMPDFDSVTTTNRDLAARMMRYVDVLVWVVDPQKYADAVIHRDFMVPLAASGAQALCVLNQADKLAPAEVPAVLASLTRLLQAEGTEAHLLSAPIAVSARTGDGVDVLRDLLAQVAAAKSLSLQRTDAQLHATASQLRTYAGGEGTVLAGAYALEAEQKLVKACYTSSQAEQVLQAATASYRRAAGQHTGWILTRWMSRLKADPLRRLHLGQQEETKSMSKAEKSSGMLGSDSENAPELVASSLPPLSAAQKAGMANAVRQYSKQMAARIDEPWKRSMKEAALSREAELPELLERDMVRIDYGLGRTRAPWVIFNALQWIALLSALVGVGWLTLISGMAYLQIQLPPAPTPEGSPVPLPTLLLLLGILLGIASAGVGRLLTAMGSRYYARKLRGRLQTGVEKAVQSCVVAPVQLEAKRLNSYRKALDI